jgi:serpin B
VATDNRFAADLYTRLASASPAGRGNLFFSPYSIRTALAMTYAGARGQTAEQMAAVLHLPQMQADQLHQRFATLIKQMNAGHDDYQLSVANALWGQSGFGFRDDFKDLLSTAYGAALREVDFARHTEQVRLEINQWAEQQTHEKIKDLVPPGVLTPATRLVLANAIYFKAAWQEPFHKNGTRDEPFHLDPSHDAPVPMMHHGLQTWGYAETGQLQALEVPYQGRDVSMVLVVPKAVDGLAQIEKSLVGQTLQQWQSSLRPQLVALTMPKFTTTCQFRLAEVLSAMGMPEAFVPMRADFSAMATAEQQKTEPLFISEVIHKAFVAADEAGTEAAAATAVTMMAGSAMRPMPHPIAVIADRPFLFYIYHRTSGTILFLGRVSDPRG